MLAAIRVAKKIIKPILFIIGIALIIAFAVAWIAAIISLFFGQPFLSAVFPDQLLLTNIGIFSLFLIVGLPLLSIIFFILRLLFDTKVSAPVQYAAIALSVLGWVGFFATASILSGSFAAGKHVEVSNYTVKNEVLEIVVDKKFEHWRGSPINIDDENFKLFMNNNQLVTQNVELNFKESEDENIFLTQKVFSRGSDMEEVETLAAELDYQLDLKGNKLSIPTHFVIDKGTKYRGQKVVIDIFVPQGKSIRLGENVLNLKDWFQTEIKSSSEKCRTLTMSSDGLVCPEDVQPIHENKTETI